MANDGVFKGGIFGGASGGGGGLFGSGPAAQSATSGPAAPTGYFLSIILGDMVKVKWIVKDGVKVLSGPGECKIQGKVDGVVVDKLQPDAVVPEVALSPTECKIMGDWSTLYVQYDLVALGLFAVGGTAHEFLEPVHKRARTEK